MYHGAMSQWLVLSLLAVIAARGEDYCFGFLNAYPDRKEIPEAQAEEIQKGHLAHMQRMGIAGHLLAAGPLLTPGGPRGIVLYRCTSVQEAQQWTLQDPAVQNKRLVLEVYRWRGPDGMGEPLTTKLKDDPSTKIQMTQLPLILFRKTEKWTGNGPDESLAEHSRRTAELNKQGNLRAAGPFTDAAAPLTGLWVFATMPLEKAIALADHDALVEHGYVRPDAYVWLVADEAIPKP